jgi:hypothetical protein
MRIRVMLLLWLTFSSTLWCLSFWFACFLVCVSWSFGGFLFGRFLMFIFGIGRQNVGKKCINSETKTCNVVTTWERLCNGRNMCYEPRRTERHTHKTKHNTDDLQWRNTTITATHSKILTNSKIPLILTILSTSVTHTRQHACNTCEAFPLKCWSPSDDGHHWPETLKTLLHLTEFNPNFAYIRTNSLVSSSDLVINTKWNKRRGGILFI